jgi:hypothetical protein
MPTIESTSRVIGQAEAPLSLGEDQLAAVAFLARYRGRTLEAYRDDLRNLFQWSCEDSALRRTGDPSPSCTELAEICHDRADCVVNLEHRRDRERHELVVGQNVCVGRAQVIVLAHRVATSTISLDVVSDFSRGCTSLAELVH